MIIINQTLIRLKLRISEEEWNQRMFGVINVLTRRSPRTLTGREEDDIPIIPLANNNNDRQFINVYESRKNQHMLEMKDKVEKEKRRQDEPKRNKRWNSPRELKLAQKTPQFAKTFSGGHDEEYADMHFEHDEGTQRQFYNRVPPPRNSYNQPGTRLNDFRGIF